jgi:hypothetical protein
MLSWKPSYSEFLETGYKWWLSRRCLHDTGPFIKLLYLLSSSWRSFLSRNARSITLFTKDRHTTPCRCIQFTASHSISLKMSCGSSFGIPTRLQDGWPGVRLLAGVVISFSSPQRTYRLWGPHSLLSNGYWGLCYLHSPSRSSWR